MKRFAVGLVVFVLAAIIAGWTWDDTAHAGAPHFVGTPTFTTSGNTITVSGKEAGLGNEAQVHIELSATAECINGGGNHPSATNKTSVSAAGDFPVQNGKANFTLSATAVFDPYPSGACGTVRFSNVTVTDTTSGISALGFFDGN
jgi:hypothetical protein